MDRPRGATHQSSRRTFLKVTGGIASTLPLAMLAGCSSERDSSTLRVAYQQFGSGTTLQQWLTKIIAEFTKKHPGVSVELVPIVAAENDYFTKNELLMSSPRSCPDLVFEDTFILLSDVAAGYIQPIDDLVKGWEGWDNLYPASQAAAVDPEGRAHCVPTETDTRGIYYNKKVFEKAGLPTEWQPRTWEEIAETAAAIRDANVDAAGMFMYCGKTQGEKASMQGFEMLLYGTNDTLYNPETKKWVAGSQGFIDTLAFYKRQFDEKLTLPSTSTRTSPKRSNRRCSLPANSGSSLTARGSPTSGHQTAPHRGPHGRTMWASPRCPRKMEKNRG